jgi:hypothetical protein
MQMTKWKRIYLTISMATLILIYVSFWFLSYSVFQGYVIAGLIFCLGVFNYFVIGKVDHKYPFIDISFGKGKLKVWNYRLLFVGLLCGLVGFEHLCQNFHSPFAYVVLSTGLFVGAFTKIIWRRTVKERST